jgi:hypothetical protein
MGVGLAIAKWPVLIHNAQSLPVMEGVAACLATGLVGALLVAVFLSRTRARRCGRHGSAHRVAFGDGRGLSADRSGWPWARSCQPLRPTGGRVRATRRGRLGAVVSLVGAVRGRRGARLALCLVR